MKYRSLILSMLAIILSTSAIPYQAVAQTDEESEVLKAARKGEPQLLATLLSKGAEVDEADRQGFTPLMAASKVGDSRVLEVILNHRPNVDRKNKAGATALMIAAKYGHKNVVKELLERGADPTLTNNFGDTAADFARRHEQRVVYGILKKAERRFRKR